MTRKKLSAKAARRARERVLAELMVSFGLCVGVSGNDSFARRARAQYKKEVWSLLARAAKLGMGRRSDVRRVSLRIGPFEVKKKHL